VLELCRLDVAKANVRQLGRDHAPILIAATERAVQAERRGRGPHAASAPLLALTLPGVGAPPLGAGPGARVAAAGERAPLKPIEAQGHAHVGVRRLHILDCIDRDDIMLQWVSTTSMIPDVMTKPLARVQLLKCIRPHARRDDATTRTHSPQLIALSPAGATRAYSEKWSFRCRPSTEQPAWRRQASSP
jgi:hypothetical protein